MEKKKKCANAKRDETIILVEYASSENAKETVYDKVKRLVMNDPLHLEKSTS